MAAVRHARAMTTRDAIPATIDPPTRLLCGPGPSNPDPRVLEAMGRPLLGHLDPDMHEVLLEVVELLRARLARRR